MIVDTDRIEAALKEAKEPSEKALSAILKEAEGLKGLSLEDAAWLLKIENPAKLKTLYDRADEIKQRIFGRRIVLFAPLYLSNYCKNACLYCGFRSANKDLPRKALDSGELINEARALEKMGFKRVLLVTGEDPLRGLDYIINSVKTIYGQTGIRIVHVNAPPMGVEGLKELKRSGAAVYQVFQETYHRPTYALVHPAGPKKDYDYRISVMDRALEAGFKDVGIGSLLGLYDSRFDCLSTIAHSRHLFENFGTHAHTISVPRLRPAHGSAIKDGGLAVSDEELKKIVSVYRLSVPSAGVVVSTREPEPLRNFLVHAGASQMSASSRTGPGGYAGATPALEQFSTSDRRSLVEVMASVIAEGGLPSLCTTCYRIGRVGENFTKITSSGGMEKFCQANAVLTLKEYTLDNPPNGRADIFTRAIEKALAEIKDPAMKKEVDRRMEELERGKRDLYL
ncbi:MAG: [FeFe] hydrogenase H-cluster radical SAM maturase HydG [Deltaproteobacteria bacterium]|nr:[FeFe] hydrogenase H-cluster radical SAM maturase HydG [Deltaproteobacteria bacterium]